METRISRVFSVRVNFMALVIRFMKTWTTRLGSRSVHDTLSAEREWCSSNVMAVEARFSSASNILSADRINGIGCEGDGDTSNRFESSRERVRMSSMMRFWCIAQ